MTDPTDCQCVDLDHALRLTLEGHTLPHCDTHDDASPGNPGAALALNDDASLIAKIGAHLGATTNAITDL
ncbi:hypothetical protein [Terrabacter sp. Root181]|uniref:hypothetical protein n=1 Tax=Terrabacter sp. Root181 TaxID=1736484 RepID=UPI00070186B0|nr:hypothetical protein [Terrabacter sp. Root181]KRB45006.1 hypothetical protein ASD90_15030 [Terrabacter sp. Root181]